MSGLCSVSSISVPFLLLLIITFPFIAQITTVSAELTMRKLGPMASPPPPPKLGTPYKPSLPPPNRQPRHPPSMP
ncbi:hypothetical protein DEO72_LG5g318 [Vigna unguiculata]|uniref:Uncharacterized protein n=1 Tax=Vigna unguiculata TaxID=3917 RepID=A0A4D6LWA0_VIGUN|nr:hypothetical protein DEO72_LG5g318 [Vigna unguiculata]